MLDYPEESFLAVKEKNLEITGSDHLAELSWPYVWEFLCKGPRQSHFPLSTWPSACCALPSLAHPLANGPPPLDLAMLSFLLYI